MRKNLAVYVLYHSQYAEGKELYSSIYKMLCRDAEHPFEDGLDIPVYLRTGNDAELCSIKPISLDGTDRIFILMLIDDNMYCSEVWQSYIQSIVELKAANTDRVHIACVAASKFAFDIGHGLGERQFIRLSTQSVKDNWQEFQIRLYDDIIRFVKHNELTKLRIFISHSKKDKNEIGKKKATEFRDYIRSKTKLDSFFDASDILDGQNFEEQIRSNSEGEASLLVILNSNTYSEREWCQKEVLFAKQNKVPTIAVSLLDGEVKRSFPYISNIPYIRFNENWDQVLILTLRTALDQLNQAQYLEIIRGDMEQPQRDSFRILPFSPEAYSYVYDELVSNIIYPEPPLTKDELNVLKKIAGNNKLFLTPMQLLAKTANLSGKKVAISVSEAPDSDMQGYGTAMIRDLVIELSRHLLIAGAKMVYGGDLRSGGYTELFSELSLQYKEYQNNVERGTFFFFNYFAWPIWLNFTHETRLQYVNSRVAPVFVECPAEFLGDKTKPIAPINDVNNLIWSYSLLKMRKQMEINSDARVILGGRMTGFSGFMPGVMEELVQSVELNHPVYLLGGFGGAASALAAMIRGEIEVKGIIDICSTNPRYQSFMEYCNANGIDMGYGLLEKIINKGVGCLNNGLSDEDNFKLLQSIDVIEIVGLIIKGLNNKFNYA